MLLLYTLALLSLMLFLIVILHKRAVKRQKYPFPLFFKITVTCLSFITPLIMSIFALTHPLSSSDSEELLLMIPISALIYAVFLLLYFSPYMMAERNSKGGLTAFFVLNLFLGWTIIAWIILMVSACVTHDQPQQSPAVIQEKVDAEDRIQKLYALRQQNALTEEEYQQMKLDILSKFQ